MQPLTLFSKSPIRQVITVIHKPSAQSSIRPELIVPRIWMCLLGSMRPELIKPRGCLLLLTTIFRVDHYHCVSVSGVALFGSTKQNLLFLCRLLPALLDPGTRLPPYPWLLLSTREPLLLQAGWKGKRGSGGTSTDTASGEKAECTGLCPGWCGWSLKRKHPSTMHYFI